MPQSRGPNLFVNWASQQASRRPKYADRVSFDKRVTKYSKCFLFLGIRVHSSGIFTNKRTVEDTRSRGAVVP